ARQITAGAASPTEAAARIENWMLANFEYVANVNDQHQRITIDQFLLRQRRGHCEYFAAGMVALLTALDIPARIVGGFYGGQWNPFGGYYVLRLSDAHAWTEVWNGTGWMTFDATPPDLRPGTATESPFLTYGNAIAELVTYYWDRWVLTYGLTDQLGLIASGLETAREALRRGRGEITAFMNELPRFLALVLGLIAAALLLFSIRRLPGRRGIFAELVYRLEQEGIRVDAATTGEELIERLRRERPDLASRVAPVVEYHTLHLFSREGAPPELRQMARAALREIRS
ncbi:MAG TPA: transglutaminase domain-containing protein, partial [Thermoanaerobaculia bacterium]|nr:transglutaminase domain-containing protein [Thermoanaerobaculia bacterium]